MSNTKFKLRYRNQLVYASISPCSWMYRGYGLQLKLSLKEDAVNAESVFLKDKTFECHDVLVEYIKAKAQTVAITYLQSSGLAPMQKAINDWAEQEKKFQAEWAVEQKKEETRLLQNHARHKAKGFTHYITGWVHSGGDDYGVEAYSKGVPTEAQIKKLLKRSVVKTDYAITEL